MKWYYKYTSIRHYLAFLRRQPAHMRHVYAFVFAGSITSVIAGVILYVDYGFWHERYTRSDVEAAFVKSADPEPESPKEMIANFLSGAGARLKDIDFNGSPFQSKEIYMKDEKGVKKVK